MKTLSLALTMALLTSTTAIAQQTAEPPAKALPSQQAPSMSPAGTDATSGASEGTSGQSATAPKVKGSETTPNLDDPATKPDKK